MSELSNFRMERIEKLFHELRHEIERGMMENEIDETIGYKFIVPISRAIPDGIVACEFRTRPMPRYMGFDPEAMQPRLRVVGGKDEDSHG
jgi:hypothetical protein